MMIQLFFIVRVPSTTSVAQFLRVALRNGFSYSHMIHFVQSYPTSQLDKSSDICKWEFWAVSDYALNHK